MILGRIDWIPIEEMPDEFKDGRDVLLGSRAWQLWGSGAFNNGRWTVSCGGEVPWEGDGDRGGLKDLPFDPTHFAEINAP